MNVFAKFDEILSMILQDIKETKRWPRSRTDSMETVYTPTNTFVGGGGYNYIHNSWFQRDFRKHLKCWHQNVSLYIGTVCSCPRSKYMSKDTLHFAGNNSMLLIFSIFLSK